MLEIHVPIGTENYDEATNEFVNPETFTLELEHSLFSLSKWEAKYEKAFLGTDEKSAEEVLFYIESCMLQTKNPPEGIFQKLSQEHLDAVQGYIGAKHSATTIRQQPSRNQQIITAEVVYGWMVALKIPFETQHWHLNRLFMLVNVCNEQRKPPQKVSRAEAAQRQSKLNAERQAKYGTKG